jgi:HPt (histidine-containing phosphotransfer) domain-containing protein
MQNSQALVHAADRNATPPSASTPSGQCTELDAAALAGLRELDPHGLNRLLERVVRAFQGSLDRMVPQLVEAQARHDAAGVRHVAHTLKSSSASIGALRLSSLCAQLEASARGGSTDGLDAQIDALCAEVKAVRPALEQLLPNA